MSEVIQRLEKVAESLPGVIRRLVFVGGGVTELLVTDSAGRKPRTTEDVDCIVEVASLFEYNQFEKILRKSGFQHDSNIPPLICRWEKEDVILDVMPTLEGILGFTNRWYQDAIQHPIPLTLPSGKIVKIVHPVFYFATKTEAFQGRGKGDYFTSHDFEDIVSLLKSREYSGTRKDSKLSGIRNPLPSQIHCILHLIYALLRVIRHSIENPCRAFQCRSYGCLGG